MNGALAVLRRDLVLAGRSPGDTLLALIFFVLALSLFPLGVGPGPQLLERIGVGLIWVLALFAVVLTLDRLYASDARDGSLEQYALSPTPMAAIALAKALAHWLTTGLVLVVASPLLVLLLNLPASAYIAVPLALLLATPTMSLIGGIGAALMLGSRRGSILMTLLVLPLYIPVLILGVSAVEAWMSGIGGTVAWLLLGALLLGSLAVAPLFTALGLKLALD